MKESVKHKRGVSEVTGSLIMLAIVIAFGTSILWVGSTIIFDAQRSFSQKVEETSRALQERYSITEVAFYNTNSSVPTRDRVNVTVTNPSSYPITIKSIFIGNEFVQPDLRTVVEFNRTHTFTLSADWTQNKDYLVRVTTMRGNAVEVIWRSP